MDWTLTSTDLQRDTRIIHKDEVGRQGSAKRCGWRSRAGHSICSSSLTPTIEQRDRDLIALWGERLAQELGAEGVRAEVPEGDTAGHELLRSHGFAQVRSAFTMSKRLGDGEDVLPPPDGVRIRRFVDGDERALDEVHEASFADGWASVPRRSTPSTKASTPTDWDPSLVAWPRGAVVSWVISSVPDKRGFRGGAGRDQALARARDRHGAVASASAEISTRDRTEVKLGVDALNPHGAVGLYESAGITVERRLYIFECGTLDSAAHSEVRAAPMQSGGRETGGASLLGT